MDYHYTNVNPLNEIESDCVCRAISLALNEDYYKVQEKLELSSKLNECEALCVCCYEFLLTNYYKLQRYEFDRPMTIREFSKHNPYGIYLVRIQGHLTCIIDNVLHDIWDCRDELVDIIWKVD